MERSEVPIPIFLNEPDKVIFWPWYEVFWFIGVWFFVWILYSFLLGLLFSFMVIKLLRLLKKNPLGDLTKIGTYWFFSSQKSFKTLPPSYIREFLG